MNPVWTDFLTSRLPGSQVKLYHCYEVKSRWCLHTHPTKSKRNRMLPSQLTPGAPEISPQLASALRINDEPHLLLKRRSGSQCSLHGLWTSHLRRHALGARTRGSNWSCRRWVRNLKLSCVAPCSTTVSIHFWGVARFISAFGSFARSRRFSRATVRRK